MLELTTRRDITLEAFRRVAWEGEPVALSAVAKAQMDAAHESFHTLLDSDPDISVYMVTTGGGEFARERIPPGDRVRLRPRSFNLALNFGEPMPERVARGIVLARLANFLEGHAAARAVVAERIAELLDGRPLPVVPRRGQGGSGEILPLGHLLHGVFDVAVDHKEGNALLNGSPCAAALAADAALAARARYEIAADVLALSIEAINAPLANYGPALDDLWGDPDEAAALRSLRARLEGGPTAGRRDYQTPVSWRILPRVLGQLHRAVRRLEQAASTSLSSVSDNPVYVPPDEDHPLGQTFSTGGYHNAIVPPALDAVSAAWADLCTIAERHCQHLFNGDTSNLPDKLVTDGLPAVSLFYLCFTQLGIGEEARRLHPTLLPPSSGGFVQSDVAAPSFLAWEQEQRTAAGADAALAILAAVASQALWITGRPAPPPLAPFVAELRTVFPPLVESRPLGADIDQTIGWLTTRIHGGAARPTGPAAGAADDGAAGNGSTHRGLDQVPL